LSYKNIAIVDWTSPPAPFLADCFREDNLTPLSQGHRKPDLILGKLSLMMCLNNLDFQMPTAILKFLAENGIHRAFLISFNPDIIPSGFAFSIILIKTIQ
jgi:hypothetical protein